METVQYKKLEMQVWDVGGQDKIRQLWRHYYNGTDAVIFVVDSADTDRLSSDTGDSAADVRRFTMSCCQTVSQELAKVLSDPELSSAALLVYANKQDLPGAVSTAEVAKRLGLATLRGRQWFVQSTVGRSGEGLYEGLDWLSDTLSKRKS